jgi:hypothetical protein
MECGLSPKTKREGDSKVMLALGLKGEATGERKSDSICVFVILVITHARPVTASLQGRRADRLVNYSTGNLSRIACY